MTGRVSVWTTGFHSCGEFLTTHGRVIVLLLEISHPSVHYSLSLLSKFSVGEQGRGAGTGTGGEMVDLRGRLGGSVIQQ